MAEHGRAVPVLVVGAGPAGAAAAGALARLGVEVLLVERRREVLGLPRATVVSTRSMELLRSWGLQDEVAARRCRGRVAAAGRGRDGAGGGGQLVRRGVPQQRAGAVVGPVPPALRAAGPPRAGAPDAAAVAARPPGSSWAPRCCTSRPAPTAPGRDPARPGDREPTWTVRARYLVAADGARGGIRADLGIGMTGGEGLLGGAMVEFRAPLWDVVGPHRFRHLRRHPARRRRHPTACRAGETAGSTADPASLMAPDGPDLTVAEAVRLVQGSGRGGRPGR